MFAKLTRLAAALALALACVRPVAAAEAPASEAARPLVAKDTVFKLVKTPVAPQAIVSQRGVAEADTLLAGKPVRFEPGQGIAVLVLDFGREVVGTVRFDVKADVPTRLEVYYGEALQEALRDTEYSERWYKRPKDMLAVRAGTQTLTNQGRRAFRYIRLVVPKGARPLTLAGVQATLQHYPVAEGGSFACSDPHLNKIWEISAYTTKLCMQQWYEDGIKRDGLLWVSDYRVQYLCNTLLFGDRDLARKCLLLMAASQFPDSGAIPAQASRAGVSQHPANINYMPGIPRGVHNWTLVNYCLDYIGCVRDYYVYTGDRQTVAEVWPAVQRLVPYLLKLEPIKLGQLSNFITDSRHNESWWGSHGTLEMQFLIGLADAAYLAEVMQDDALRAKCAAYLPRQRQRVQETYFAKDMGFFVDEPGKRQSSSWHVNAFAALAGVAEYAPLAERLQKAAIPVRPATSGFMLYWTLRAKFAAGQGKAALDDIRKIWGHMLRYGATTTWEKCDLTVGDHPDENKAADSRCHGWSAGPAWLLPACVLGVQPKTPGFAAVEIQPQLGDLQWAEGTIPTPKGFIRVRWESSPTLHGTVTLPEGMTGEVKLPGQTIPLKPGTNPIQSPSPAGRGPG